MTQSPPKRLRWVKYPLAVVILACAGAALLVSYAFTAPYLLGWLYRVPAVVFGASAVTACWLCYRWLGGKLTVRQGLWLLLCSLFNSLAVFGWLAARP